MPEWMNAASLTTHAQEFNAAGTLLAVRPYCRNGDFWQVFFDTSKVIAELGGMAGWPVPAPHQINRQG